MIPGGLTALMVGGVGDPGTDVIDAVDFDGTSDYMLRGGALTGVVDGKKGTFSAWVRFDGGDGSNQMILWASSAGSERVKITRTTGNKFYIYTFNSVSDAVVVIGTSTSFTASTQWVHVLASWDSSTAGARYIYIDDVDDTSVTTFANLTIDYAMASAEWAIGSNDVGTNKLNGCIAELYFNAASYLDLSVESNRRKFRTSDGRPVPLGVDGRRPTGTVPAIYQHLHYGAAASGFNVNSGSGGNFTITGSLDTASTRPSAPIKPLICTAVTYDASDLTTYTFTGVAIGPAHASRVIHVGVTGRFTAARTISSVSIDGTNGTINVQAQNATPLDMAGIASRAVAAGTTCTIVVTFSAGVSRCGIVVWASYGSSATASDTDTDTDNSNPLTASIDVPARGFVLAIAGDLSPSWTWSGVTEDADEVIEGGISSISGASEMFDTAQTALAITATPASGANRILVAAAFP